jgi:hypothetical protein
VGSSALYVPRSCPDQLGRLYGSPKLSDMEKVRFLEKWDEASRLWSIAVKS